MPRKSKRNAKTSKPTNSEAPVTEWTRRLRSGSTSDNVGRNLMLGVGKVLETQKSNFKSNSDERKQLFSRNTESQNKQFEDLKEIVNVNQTQILNSQKDVGDLKEIVNGNKTLILKSQKEVGDLKESVNKTEVY